MSVPIPVLHERDGFPGQNEHLRDAIEAYQQLAAEVGPIGLAPDGWYGSDSVAATTALQRTYGFFVDGVARPALVRWMRHLQDHPEDRVEPPAGVTVDQLIAIVGSGRKAQAERHRDGLAEAMATYDISTPLRQAHFLAQVAHESAGFFYTREIASGEAYEGRVNLGNTQPGDGKRFKGRGLIQLTGRANYHEYTGVCQGRGDAVDFETDPDGVGEPPYAADVAGWFWDSRSINALADRDDVVAVTERINGGRNGLDDRTRYLNKAKQALGV